MTRLRQRLHSGSRMCGLLTGIADESFVETAAHAGFDFVMLDLEHYTISDLDAARAVRAAGSAGVPVLARLTLEEVARVPRFLDGGGEGVMVAHVNSIDEVRLIEDHAFFPPLGRRGAGANRLSDHGFKPTTPEALVEENERIVVGIQLEDRLGVDMAAELLSHRAVHWTIVGTRDLSVDLGVPGDYGDARVMHAMHLVRDAARQLRKPMAEVLRDLGDRTEDAPQITILGLAAILQFASARAQSLPKTN